MDTRARPWLRCAPAALAAACALVAHAGEPAAPEAPYAGDVRALAQSAAARAGAARVEVVLGALDPRLRLAPCERVEPHLPAGARLWGRTRVGLRCTRGPARWNVYVPVTVKVYGPALVAAAPLPAGTVVGEADLRLAEVDLAAAPGAAFTATARVAGRTLARALNAGETLRDAHLRPRQWFAAGETVTVLASGAGFRVAGEAEALTPGIEGRPARVKTASGRVLTGLPAGERRLELAP